MSHPVDELIQRLDSFVPCDNDVDSVNILYEITDNFDGIEAPEKAVPRMFALLEKFPDAELGTPGPLVHCIESVDGYESQLIESIHRRPTYLTVWMVNRRLNSTLTEEERTTFLEILNAVSKNKALLDLADDAAQLLEYQNLRLDNSSKRSDDCHE